MVIGHVRLNNRFIQSNLVATLYDRAHSLLRYLTPKVEHQERERDCKNTCEVPQEKQENHICINQRIIHTDKQEHETDNILTTNDIQISRSDFQENRNLYISTLNTF